MSIEMIRGDIEQQARYRAETCQSVRVGSCSTSTTETVRIAGFRYTRDEWRADISGDDGRNASAFKNVSDERGGRGLTI